MHEAELKMGFKPNFLGIGVAKAGTSTITKILGSHPQISFSPKGKELHYFDYPETMKTLGPEGYFQRFRPNVAVGEFTPSYLFVPECRDRIYETLGEDVRFIVTLRNPVDRAFSHYCHAINNWDTDDYRARGYPTETLSFRGAIECEEERLNSGVYHIRHLSYFNKGLYAKQLRWYFEKFPRDNFYIYLLEDFVADKQTILMELYRFLGVDETYESRVRETHVNAQTNRVLSQSERLWLIERYKPDITELEEILQRDLSSWYA